MRCFVEGVAALLKNNTHFSPIDDGPTQADGDYIFGALPALFALLRSLPQLRIERIPLHGSHEQVGEACRLLGELLLFLN